MNHIAIATRTQSRTAERSMSGAPRATRELLGARPKPTLAPAGVGGYAGAYPGPTRNGRRVNVTGTLQPERQRPERQRPEPAAPITVAQAPATASDVALITNEIERTVKRLPTIYVIAFFAVVVTCAVAIIWNTLQVDRLAAERSKLDDAIAQTEQRLIRLRAEQMQLSAASRVGAIAHAKFGMVDAMSEDIITVK